MRHTMFRIAITLAGVLLLIPGCKDKADPPPGGPPGAPPGAPPGGPVSFSFTPPAGWGWQDVPGLKHKAAVGPPSRGFAPNINVVEDSYGGSMEDYVQGNLATLRRVIPGFRLLS